MERVVQAWCRAAGRGALPLLWGALLGTCVIASTGCRDGSSYDAFVVALDVAPNGLDPRFATSDASAKLMGLIHAGLMTQDTRSGKPKPQLAESVEQVSPTRYRVVLREGIAFHDGHPVRAEDVEYTLTKLDSESVRSPKGVIATRIESFEIRDARHFTIVLDKPYAAFTSDMTLGIVPKHRCEGRQKCRGKIVGAGPYRLVESKSGVSYRLEKFSGYFRDVPGPEQVEVRVMEDGNTRLLGLLGKAVDLTQNAISPIMLPVVEESDSLELQTGPSFKYTYLSFNLRHAILSDVRVRRAIAYGIDRRAIIEHKFRGHARLSTGLLAPNHWAYEQDVARYPYRPDKARKLLDKAGYPDPDGEGSKPRFTLQYKVSANQFRQTIAELIAYQLRRIGIRVRVRAYEWGTFYSDIKSGNFELTSMQWPTVTDPNIYRWIFHSENIPSADDTSAGANRGAYKNKEVDRLLDRAKREVDRDKRIEMYSRLQKILARQLPYVSLWHEDNLAVKQKGVEGYYMTPNARLIGITEIRQPPGTGAAEKKKGTGPAN